jgi:hypothetical protein
MILSSLQPTIAAMSKQGITVWLHMKPDHIRIVLQNKADKLAKQEVAWDIGLVKSAMISMAESLAA